MIFTRKELNKKAIDYVNNKIKDGLVVIYRDNDHSCRDQFYHIECKVSNTEKLGELVSFGLNCNSDYDITIVNFIMELELQSSQKVYFAMPTIRYLLLQKKKQRISG